MIMNYTIIDYLIMSAPMALALTACAAGVVVCRIRARLLDLRVQRILARLEEMARDA